LLCTILSRVSQTGFEGLAIGVHVGKERNPHGKLDSITIARRPGCVDIYQR
jgi:hypothetical protein